MSKKNNKKGTVKSNTVEPKVTVVPKDTVAQQVATVKEDANKAVSTVRVSDNVPGSVTSATLVGWATLAQDRYVHGNNMGKQYPREFLEAVNDQIDVCAMGALILASEEAKAKGGTLKLLFPEDKLPNILNAAASIGIAIPTVHMIESKDEKGVKQLTLPFDEAEVPADIKTEAKKEIQKKAEAEVKPIELDPKKFASDDDLYKAGSFILTDNSKGQFAKRVAAAIDLFKTYRLLQCGNDTAKKEAVENKSISDWLDELITKSDNGVVLKCLARGMYTSLSVTHCPIGAFLLLRKNLMDEKKVPIWTDESIALAVNSLTELAAKDIISEMIDAQGKPKPGAITDIKDDNNLNYLHFFSEDVIKDVMNPEKRAADSNIKNIYGLALANYFDNTTSKSVTADMQGVIENKIGQVANLFRPVEAQFENYTTPIDAKVTPEKTTTVEKPVEVKTEETKPAEVKPTETKAEEPKKK